MNNFSGDVVEQLSNNGNDLVDLEDDESSPITSTPNDDDEKIPIKSNNEKPSLLSSEENEVYCTM